jgi:hypothetical protein
MVFGVTDPDSYLSKGIDFFETVHAPDNKSKYTHSGILTGEKGQTFEALWKLKEESLFRYEGKPIVIAVPTYILRELLPPGAGFVKVPITMADAKRELKTLRNEYEGHWYPAWRIPLHIFGPLAKINWTGLAVCSELTAKYLWMIRARFSQWAGTTPDRLADEWHRWEGNFDIVYEGLMISRREYMSLYPELFEGGLIV